MRKDQVGEYDKQDEANRTGEMALLSLLDRGLEAKGYRTIFLMSL
jgi:hypothetical protein